MTSIGLDLVYLAPGATGGMETYARALVPELSRLRPDTRWVAFCGRELAAELRDKPWCPRLEVVELPVSAESRVRRVALEQALLPQRILRSGVQLVHSLANMTPLAPGGPPRVLTIQDLIWARLPETHSRFLRTGVRFLAPRAARRAAGIIVPSRATAADVERYLDIPAERIHVIPLGPGGDLATATPEHELRARLGLGSGSIVLCPAPRRPHKNVRRLIAATAGLHATVVVPGYASIEEQGLNGMGHVRYPGWLSNEDMEGLYRAATLLAFPSLAEGFGLPVLEAMRRGLAVACADATSLPEVAGDAALRFDPLDVHSIRAAVARLLGDPALREELARRGRTQAARFSWTTTAERTWGVYDRLGGDAGAGRSRGILGRRLRPPAWSRRIAGHRRVLPATALLLRARTVETAPAFVLRELRGGGRVASYQLRGVPVHVVVRHGVGDAPTLGEIFHERQYAPPPALRAAFDPAVILDLGANIGLFGAFASAQWPQARLVAYEPDPANADVCRLCIHANRLEARWELRRAAASNRAGELRFHASGDALSHRDESGELLVEAHDVLPELASADLVKMDIEGSEWAILTDPRFSEAPPRAIVLEYHPHLCPGSEPRAVVEHLLRKAGLSESSPVFHRADGYGMLWAWRP